jgi:hypothetical protein
MKFKTIFLAFAIFGALVAIAAVSAQDEAATGTGDGIGASVNGGDFDLNFGGAAFDWNKYAAQVEELMKAPIGKMNIDIYIEVTARLAACYKDTLVTDSVFNNLKQPYDITPKEYGAYVYQMMAGKTNDDAGKFEDWVKKYDDRIKELKQNGCVFNTNPDGTTNQPCIDADGDDPDRANILYYYGEIAKAGNEHYVCSPCKYKDECVGDAVREQICKDGNPWETRHECEWGCFAGRCQTEEESKQQKCEGQCLETCPSGTMDFDTGGCPKKDGKKNACCQKVFDKPEVSGTCSGSCMKSSTCPEGYENKGMDSCVQEENCYKCGLFNLFTCCDYAKKSCCVPKADVPAPVPPEKCNGICSAGGCLGGWATKNGTDCAPEQKCKACGFFGLKKCCEYQATTCCEPVTTCKGGMCTYDDCPSGTLDIGYADCGKQKDCETCCSGFGKKCKNKQTKCCVAVPAAKCDKGTCQKSSSCPAGQKSIGAADCGSYEKEHSCGFANMAKCKDPAPKTCCVPE